MGTSFTDSLDTPATISVRDLRVNYGEREILHGITFDVIAAKPSLFSAVPVLARVLCYVLS